MHHNWQRLTLTAWARWCAAGKPLPFSPYGDSIAAKDVFTPRHRRTYRDDVPLWHDDQTDEGVDELLRVDTRLCGALSASERRVLLAAVVPLGRACPAAERAAAAGVSVDHLRAIQRRAVDLVG